MIAFRCFRSALRFTSKRSIRSLIPLTQTQLIMRPIYSFSQFDLGKHKEQSKKFYAEEVSQIVEITKKEDWNTLVMNAAQPIVLDCYAEWCKPCKKLTPILEGKAKGAKDWKLVKLDIDKFPQIAQALQIKAVPTVYLIVGGRPVDGFSGMPDDKVLNSFFGSLEKILKLGTQGEQQAKRFDEARAYMQQRKFVQAEKILLELVNGKLVSQLQPVSRLLLAECYLNLNKLTNFDELIQQMKVTYKRELQTKGEQYDMLREFMAQLEQRYLQLKQAPLKDDQIETLKSSIAKDPTNLESKYKLAQLYSKKQLLEQSMQLLLEIIKINKTWQDKKANKLLLDIFKKLGQSSQLTNKYRKLYQRLLY